MNVDLIAGPYPRADDEFDGPFGQFPGLGMRPRGSGLADPAEAIGRYPGEAWIRAGYGGGLLSSFGPAPGSALTAGGSALGWGSALTAADPMAGQSAGALNRWPETDGNDGSSAYPYVSPLVDKQQGQMRGARKPIFRR